MKLYLVSAAPPFLLSVRADAKREAKAAGVDWRELEIPSGKAGIMAAVNDLLAAVVPAARVEGAEEAMAAEEIPEEAPEPYQAPPPRPLFSREPAPGRAGAPRLFSAGPDIDAIEEAIEKLDGYQLGNVAQTVCCRMKELAKPLLNS